MGSSVDNAAAPVSPRNSAPRLLDFRRGRGISSYILVGKLPEFSSKPTARERKSEDSAIFFLNGGRTEEEGP